MCFFIIHVNFDPKPTMVLKLKRKNDLVEEPDMYLGSKMTQDNIEGEECCAMSSDSYCAALVKM